METINDYWKRLGKLDTSSRLQICEDISRHRVMKNMSKPYSMINPLLEPYNHELELIALHSVIVPERTGLRITRSDWLKSCTKFIREQRFITENPFKNAMIMIATLSYHQFSGQQSYEQLYYRYNFMYNFQNDIIDMKYVLTSKYGIEYNEIRRITYQLLLWSTMSSEFSYSLIIQQYLKPDLLNKIHFLVRKLEDFKEDFNKVSNHNLIYSFNDYNLLAKYPIILYSNKYYIPYVPNIVLATTKSLMFDLTIGNDPLRQLIGKEVFESYIGHLLKHSEVTKDLKIVDEFKYDSTKLSSDYIVISRSHAVFIEAKFMNVGLKLRMFDDDSMVVLFERLADHLVQVYKNMHNYSLGLMNHKLPRDLTCYGLVVIYDDLYLLKDKIYDLAVEKINGEFSEKIDKSILTRQTIIVPLHSFEMILNYSTMNFIEYFMDVFQNKTAYLDYSYAPLVLSETSRIFDYDKYIDSLEVYSDEELKEYWNLDD